MESERGSRPAHADMSASASSLSGIAGPPLGLQGAKVCALCSRKEEGCNPEALIWEFSEKLVATEFFRLHPNRKSLESTMFEKHTCHIGVKNEAPLRN